MCAGRRAQENVSECCGGVVRALGDVFACVLRSFGACVLGRFGARALEEVRVYWGNLVEVQ